MPKALAAKSSKGKDTEQAQKHPAEVARQPISTSPGGAVLALQRSAGNHAVEHSLGQGLRTLPSTSGFLQRKCACGNNAMAGGECEECGKKERLGLQTKLTVNEPGDIYEQEADRIADQVLAVPAHTGISGAPLHIQRFAGQPAGQMDAAPASVDQALASPGRPLEPALRQDMEQRFDRDFSRVRVHDGVAANRSARDVNAHAYTVGHNIVFGTGLFAPVTYEGRRLIAHELAHVVQQSGSVAGARIQRQPYGGARATSTELRGENRALRDGVRKEKWSEELESQYRKRGHFERADAIRDCRLKGAPACRKIITKDELLVLYDRDVLPQQTADGVPISYPTSAEEPQAGIPNPAEETKFSAPTAAAGTALAAKQVTESTATKTALTRAQRIQQGAARGIRLVTARATTATAASTVAAETGAAAGAAGALPAVAVGGGVAVLVIAGVQADQWMEFQKPWIAAGYILLDDPLGICIGGCHLPSGPRLPQFPNFPDFPPVEPVRPFPFHPPQQPLPPGWTELKPFEAGRAAPRATPTQEPKSRSKPVPKPDPRTEDRRKRERCEPHLELPKGKQVHYEWYGYHILASSLAAHPTKIINRQRTTAYERNPNQVKKWFEAVDPDKNGKMSRKVLERGTKELGIEREFVLKPDWAPNGKFMQMDVDHIIELQLGFILGDEALDNFDNYELLDSSTNSSVGPTIDHAIQKERNRLKIECPGFVPDWDEVPLIFVLPIFHGGGKGPGLRWTTEEILKGKHLDVYPGRRGRRGRS